MKYSELERLVKKAGCYYTGKEQAGHPLWRNPKNRNVVSDEPSPKRRSRDRYTEEDQKGSGD